MRRRLVLFGDAHQSVWVASGMEHERREVVRWIHEHGRTRLGRLLELEADEVGESSEDWLALHRVMSGPCGAGSDISAVCIHNADRLSRGSLKLVLGVLNEMESAERGLGAPRLIATSADNLVDADTTEELRHLLLRLDVLHFEIPGPLADLSSGCPSSSSPANRSSENRDLRPVASRQNPSRLGQAQRGL